MAAEPKTREAAQKAYEKEYAQLREAQLATKAAKQVLDGFIIRENLAARLNIPVEALDGEDLDTLQRLSQKAKETGASKPGTASIEAVIGKGE